MISLALLMLQAAPAAATCPVTPAALPPALAGWSRVSPAPTIGKRFSITGSKAAGATTAEAERGGTAASFPIRIESAGSYGVALSGPAWIDITAASKTLASTGHDHGPACSGIRKIVRFMLAQGDYTIRLSGITTPAIDIMLAKTEAVHP